MNALEKDPRQVIKSIGLVFGDIGTSPIYTLTIAFFLLKNTTENIMGVISLVIWTLILLVFIKYAWLAMSLGVNGEGGTVVLRETLLNLVKNNKSKVFITFLTFIGISLLLGDGVITPAISILSAVEGLLVIPGLEKTPQVLLIIFAAVIAIGLFAFQRKGTDKVAKTFGPIMVVWFSALGISGLVSIFTNPSILMALNPYHAILFFVNNGLEAFFALSIVFLCATGSEALFADMGHLGRKPIITGWYFIFIALVLNYLGQGAFLLEHKEFRLVIFEMIYGLSPFLYIPFLILSIIATVIASQAMISGMFSIVFQAIRTRILPMFKIDYTSPHMHSQIYIGAVNWFLLVFVILIMIVFKESINLGAAYGLAVSGDMVITGLLMFMIFYNRKSYFKLSVAGFLILIDLLFFVSNTTKIPTGGYWSILISIIPLMLIVIYNIGNRRVYKALKPVKLAKFMDQYLDLYANSRKIVGTSVFFIRSIEEIPPYISMILFENNIVYEDNVFVSIGNTTEPYGIKTCFKESPASGIRVFEIDAGYMELIDLVELLEAAQIRPKVIFYGIEDFVTESIIMRVYAVIKKLVPSFVQFYKLPSNKVHGVITRIEI